jgi:hypothetical protein
MILAYITWIAATAGSILDLLLFRAAINQIHVLGRLPKNAFHFVDRASLFVVGAVCLFLIVLGEGYFHDGAEQGDLKRRAIKVLGVEALLAIVFYVVPVVMAML